MIDDRFKYYFTLVGSLNEQHDILEKIYSDMGIFDTSALTSKNKSSFITYLLKCFNIRYYNQLADSKIEELITAINNDVQVSANWCLLPPKETDNKLSITYFLFRNKKDKDKYLLQKLLGPKYQILNQDVK